MKVRELITRLENLGEPDAEVRIWSQPNHHPLEHGVGDVLLDPDEEDDGPGTVLLIEGSWLSYGRRLGRD